MIRVHGSSRFSSIASRARHSPAGQGLDRGRRPAIRCAVGADPEARIEVDYVEFKQVGDDRSRFTMLWNDGTSVRQLARG
jgi:hypothetical protein